MKIFEILLLISLQQVYSEIHMKVMDLKTTDTFFRIHVIPFNEEEVRISSNITIIGDLEKNIIKEKPKFYFENLVVSAPGTIKITAEGLNNGSFDSTIIEVEDAIKQIQIQIPDGFKILNEELGFIINITNQYSAYLSKETDIYIDDGINQYKAYTNKSVYHGNVTYTLEGSYNITVILEDRTTATKEIKLIENPIQIIMDDKKNFTSKESQNLEIILELSDSENINVTLELKCLNFCSGTGFTIFDKYKDDSYKVEINKNISLTIYILSSGTFIWVVTTENKFTRKSDSFTVVNSVKKISSYFSNRYTTAYFPVKYTIEVYGDDNQLYLAPVEVNINDFSNTSSVNIQTLNFENGTEYIEIYYNNYLQKGKYEITCKNLLKKDIKEDEILVYPNQLVLTKTKNWYPKNKADSFRFNISVYNHEKNLIESNYGIHNLTITLDSNKSSLSGSQLSLITKNGSAEINDFYINSAGTYSINVSCPSCQTLITNEFKIEYKICEFESSAIVCMSVFTFFFIFFSLLFARYDDDGERLECKSLLDFLLKIHPASSLYYNQDNYRRTRNCLHLLSSGLSLLVIIGAMYFYFDTPDISGGNEFKRFDNEELKKGGAAFGIQQLWIFFLFFLNYLTIGIKKIKYISIFLEIQTIISGIIGTVIMSLQVCKGFTRNWTYNFLFFYFLDLIFMKFIHIFILKIFKLSKVERIVKINNF